MPGVTLHENGGSQAGDTLRVVTDEETETMPRKQLSRAAGEMCAVLKIDDQGYTHHHSKTSGLRALSKCRVNAQNASFNVSWDTSQ